jgi:hypothetical protein
MSMLQWIAFLARCRKAYYAALQIGWVKCMLGLIKHIVLFVLTVYFAAEGADPYAPMHIVLADMIWVYSVFFYYMGKLLMAISAAFTKFKMNHGSRTNYN